jgi:Tfp pilus assembly major pilin PilA
MRLVGLPNVGWFRYCNKVIHSVVIPPTTKLLTPWLADSKTASDKAIGVQPDAENIDDTDATSISVAAKVASDKDDKGIAGLTDDKTASDRALDAPADPETVNNKTGAGRAIVLLVANAADCKSGDRRFCKRAVPQSEVRKKQ